MLLASQRGAILWETLKDTYHITNASYSLARMQQNNRCIPYDSRLFCRW